MFGMSATQELSTSHMNMLSAEIRGAQHGSRFARAQAAELEILVARRHVRNESDSLESARRTLMTSDSRHGNTFLIADSHKIITRAQARLADAQARLVQAYAERMPVAR